MRRLLSFTCEGALMAASLDAAAGTIGILMVTGGSQTRIGSHRMYERLAKALVQSGFSCFRYDRRGVGDSGGEDPGFRGSAPDLAAAAAAFRAERPGLARIIGLGLCDGATAIALYGRQAGLDGLILINPWLVEAQADQPPPAAIRHHYRRRLLSLEGWRSLLAGTVDYRKLLRGIRSLARSDSGSPLADETAAALARSRLPARLILAKDDATAVAAADALKAPAFTGLIQCGDTLPTDSHTFARPGDESALLAAVVRAVNALGGL